DVLEKAADVLELLAKDDAEVRRVVAVDAGALHVLVSHMTSKSGFVQQRVVTLMAALTRDATSRQAVARAPGFLQGLTTILKHRGAPRWLVLEALRVVGADEAVGKELLKVPDLVHVLVDKLDKQPSEAVILTAAGVLQSITGDLETGKRIASTPEGLKRLAKLLKSGSGRLRKVAADIFSQLAVDAELGKAIAEEPGAIEQLVVVLGIGGADGAQESAALVLHRLAWDLECRPLIGAAPGCLQKLFRLFKGPGEYVQIAAGEALWCTASGNGNTDAVWARSGVLQELVGLLGKKCTDVQRAISARILHNLARGDKEKARAIAATPGCLEGLFGLLECSESEVAEWGLRALWELVADPETRAAVLGKPGLLQTLVGFLDPEAFDESMLDVSPHILQEFLAADVKNREAFLSIPGSLEKLVRVLGTEVPEAATWLLIDLAGDLAVRRKIAGIPGALQNFVELLKQHWMREVALEALLIFAEDEEIRRGIAAVPRCLETLRTLASLPAAEIQEGEDPGLRELAAGVLRSLKVTETEGNGPSAGKAEGAGSETGAGSGEGVKAGEAGVSEGAENGVRGESEERGQNGEAELNGKGLREKRCKRAGNRCKGKGAGCEECGGAIVMMPCGTLLPPVWLLATSAVTSAGRTVTKRFGATGLGLARRRGARRHLLRCRRLWRRAAPGERVVRLQRFKQRPRGVCG
ncbi:hypothetical protein KFL_012880010, partial [Klebsormidium nitens]